MRWSERDLSAERRLLLGRRRPCAGAARGRRPVPAGHHRRHAGGRRAVGLIDGVRECAILEGAAARPEATRTAMAPKLAITDGALGFWQAIEEVCRGPRPTLLGAQTADVLNKLPKSQQIEGQTALQEIWMAETSKDALAAFDVLSRPGASNTTRRSNVSPRIAIRYWPFTSSGRALETLRTTNVIEGSFATMRHRTVRSKGCLRMRLRSR